ncbi:GerW family sporulation protein [uncultured Oscillibacter sp.]|uniref:GerW family sporulation protein n=1 Tax=uncultured Oscillibacter sp. TaxID=876091 RepID=UPI0025D8074A|nr:GerW family sporulation protein [uncultured Oscillibacter sp.]
MDNTTEKRHLADSLMRSTIEKIHEMVDTNAIVGQPINTPDGVTLIPISRVSIGFGTGGGDYGKAQPRPSGGGGGGGVKIDPVAFLIVKDGVTRVLPVAVPPVTAVDRIVDMVPDLMDKAEKYLDKKKAEKEQETL